MTCFHLSDVVLLYNTCIHVLTCPFNSDDNGNNDAPANGVEMNVVATAKVA
jgi:hypothetical protein